MNKNFASNLFSQGSIEQDYLSKMYKVFVFWVFNKNTNFSNEFQQFPTEFPTIYDLLFLIAIYFPKNDNKHPSKMRN